MANRNYTPNCNSCLKVSNSVSIDFSGSGTTQVPLTANLNISAASGNTISILSDGVYAGPAPSPRTTFTLTTDGSYSPPQGGFIQAIIVNPSGVLPSFQVGTFIGDASIIWNQSLAAGVNVFTPGYYVATNTVTLYFQNIIHSTTITIITL